MDLNFVNYAYSILMQQILPLAKNVVFDMPVTFSYISIRGTSLSFIYKKATYSSK